MTINLTLGHKEKFEVELKRNQFTGKFTYTENGLTKMLRSPIDKTTHFPTGNIAHYHFAVGGDETFDIRVVHSWPERFPAFRRQKYEIYVNGEIFKTIESY